MELTQTMPMDSELHFPEADFKADNLPSSFLHRLLVCSSHDLSRIVVLTSSLSMHLPTELPTSSSATPHTIGRAHQPGEISHLCVSSLMTILRSLWAFPRGIIAQLPSPRFEMFRIGSKSHQRNNLIKERQTHRPNSHQSTLLTNFPKSQPNRLLRVRKALNLTNTSRSV
ncbi:hypothetical protein BJ508DRAFT_57763 [Ascobolus immersus RN42]|uniref:Uncharacterized protein n=1 Tax=Ascobolus immersus RN42 TaxID=1160509 RepID=A0A3N4HG43_ASCIM|nr:hypothetical protein BJ508DRAFT_57763 [Ascobolus immersus RN42]